MNLLTIHHSTLTKSTGTVSSYPKNTSLPFEEKNIWDGYPEEINVHME